MGSLLLLDFLNKSKSYICSRKMNNSTEYNEQQFKMGIFNSFIEMQINNHYSFHINNYFLQFLTILHKVHKEWN